MAANAVVGNILELVNQAAAAIRAKPELNVRAVVWLVEAESGRHELLVATPLMRAKGPKASYAAIQKALLKAKLDQIFSLTIVRAVDPNDPLISEIRRIVFPGITSHLIEYTLSGIRYSQVYIALMATESAG